MITRGTFAFASRLAECLLVLEKAVKAERNDVRVAGEVKMFGKSSIRSMRRVGERLEPEVLLFGLLCCPSFLTGRKVENAVAVADGAALDAMAETGTATLSYTVRVPKERLEANVARPRKAGS